MANDLMAPEDLTYKVEYDPAKLNFLYFDELKEQVVTYTAGLKNMVVTEDTVKDAKEVKANLGKLKKAVNDRRIEIHKDYEKPYKDFESKVKEISGVIDDAITPIDAAVEKLKQQTRDERKAKLTDFVGQFTESRKLTVDEVEQPDQWLNEEFWTAAGNPSAKLTKTVAAACDRLVEHKKRVHAEKEAVEAYAKSNGLDPEPWVMRVDNDYSADDIREQIDRVIQQREADKQLAANKAAAAKAIAEAKQTQVGQKTINAETGEVIEDVSTVSKPVIDGQTVLRLTVKGTAKQLKAVTDFMRLSQIQYEIEEG